MENYGLAITDCDEGIKLDPTYIKSYYRQGSAYLLLSKLEQAKANFTKANQLSNSKDDDILEKLKLVKELIFKKKFAEAIRKEEEEEEIKLTDI
jgi:serine/threonine-protein phosphatase 5